MILGEAVQTDIKCDGCGKVIRIELRRKWDRVYKDWSYDLFNIPEGWTIQNINKNEEGKSHICYLENPTYCEDCSTVKDIIE